MKVQFETEQQSLSPEQARDFLHNATQLRYKNAMSTEEGRKHVKAWRDIDDAGAIAKRARQLCDAITSGAGKHGGISLPKQGTRSVDFLRSVFGGEEIRSDLQKIVETFQGATDRNGAVVNVAELLTSDTVDFGTKHEWFTAKLLPILRFLDGRDIAEARKMAEEDIKKIDENSERESSENTPQLPPSKSDSLTPSMDEMTKSKEGEAGVWFTVRQAFGGYWPEQSFDAWNEQTMKWERLETGVDSEWKETVGNDGRRAMSMTIRGGERTALPIAYGFVPDASKMQSRGGDVRVFHDGDGFVLEAAGGALVSVGIEIARGQQPDIAVPKNRAQLAVQFGEKGEKILTEIQSMSVLEKANHLRKFVRETLKYSNDSSMNAIHRAGDAAEYFERIEQHGLADCDVANTYFLGLCRRAGIAGALIAGHYVQNKDSSGATVMSSGTAHAWSRVWDDISRKWIRMDATPKGDPNMEEGDEEDPGKPDDGEQEGDFGEQDATDVSDEELERMEKDISRQAKDRQEQKQSTDPVHTFAKEAGISADEARTILAAINRAKETKDSKGRNILRRMEETFGDVVQENRRTIQDESMTTMSRGQKLRNPVRAFIDLRSGNLDPRGFSRKESREIMEQVYGGFDVVLVVDKSGSMSEMQSDGQTKAMKQQAMMFVLAEALHGAAKAFRKLGTQCISPVDIRLSVVSFGSGASRIELPLGETWGPKEQTLLWKSMQQNIGGGTPDFLGLETAQHLLGDPNVKRLRLILGSTDGDSDDAVRARKAADDIAVAGTGTVVAMAGIGTGAKNVKSTYGDRGTWLSSFDALPEWAAEHVVNNAKKLIPKQGK